MDEKRKRYENDTIAITFAPARCIHAAECGRNLSAVFDAEKKPWIDPNGAAADAIADTIHKCPSGALQYERKDGRPDEAPAGRNTVRAVKNGPVYVRGNLEILNADGDLVHRDTRVSLCRCGDSKHKPFCDNTHIEEKFAAPAGMADRESAPGSASAPGSEPGALRMTLALNGPILMSGPYAVIDDEGKVLFESEKGALCRCGKSSNKPFCDGAHKQGWTAD
ncbi:MAG: hypothetical protein HKN20_07030 [Gemmatimonadetes bacterium]|nr:hypothetical protein [Gemmatimonadota bacterium]